MEQGDIYVLTSPSGKKYVGQSVQFLPCGKRHGYIKRWKQHVYEAKTGKDFSVCLNNAIRKYGEETFTVELLLTCNISDLNRWEQHYIKHLNTFHPNGYNLTEGGSNGRQSLITREKKRISGLGKNKGKQYPRRPRKLEEDGDLPKYVRSYHDSNGKDGYRVCNHPSLKDRSFLSKLLTMEEKKTLALEYLATSERLNE
jgi:group I intron endonuclease